MDILDVREELEEAKTDEEVEAIRLRNQEKIRNAQSTIEKLIEERRWKDAQIAVTELKYMTGIEDATREWRNRNG